MIATLTLLLLLSQQELHSPAQSVSPDGRLFAYAVNDGTLRLAEFPWATPRWCTRGLSADIDHIEWNPTGDLVAAIAHDARVFVLRVSDGGIVLDLPPGERFVLENPHRSTVAFLHGGRFLLAEGGKSKCRLYDTAGGTLLREFLNPHETIPSAIATSMDGEHFALGDTGGSVGVYEAASGALVGGPWVVPAPVNVLAFGSSGALLAVGAGDQTARVYEFGSRAGPRLFSYVGTITPPNVSIGHVEFSPDGSRMLTTCVGPSEVRCWTVEDTGLAWAYEEGSNNYPMRASFARDPSVVFVQAGGSVRDARSGAQIRAMPTDDNWRWSTSNRADYAWSQYGASIHFVDIRDGTPVCKIPLTSAPEPESRAQAVSPDGKLFAFSLDNGIVRVVSLPDGGQVRSIGGLSRRLDALAFSPDGKQVGSVALDGTIRVFSTTGHGATRLIQPGPELIASYSGWRSIAFVDGGTKLFVTGGKGLTRLLEVDSGKPVRQWTLADVSDTKAESTIGAHSVSQDGKHVAIGDDLGRFGVFSATSGALEVGPWYLPRGVNSLAFDNAAHRLAVGGGHCAAWVYALDSAEMPHEYSHCDSDWFGDLEVGSVSFGNEGRTLLTASFPFWELRAWDVATGRQLWKYDYHGGNPFPISARLTPDATHVIVSKAGVRLDAATGSTQGSLAPEPTVDFRISGAVAWRTNGDRMEVFDVQAWKPLCVIPLYGTAPASR